MSEQEIFFRKANHLINTNLAIQSIISFGLFVILTLLILWMFYFVIAFKILSMIFKALPKLEKKLDKKNNIFNGVVILGCVLSLIYGYFITRFWFM